MRVHLHFCLEKLHPVPMRPTHLVRVHPAILSRKSKRQQSQLLHPVCTR